jgi:hypothetical protein
MRAAFDVAHALAREGKRFENPLALDELYDLVVVIRLRIQWVPARTSATLAAVRVGGARWRSAPKSSTLSFTLWNVVARRIDEESATILESGAMTNVVRATSLQEPMELGGWKSYEMVLRYAHLAPEHLSQAAGRIERALEIVVRNATISLR